MEDTYTNGDYPQDCLRKLVIPEDAIGDLLARMIGMGFGDSVIFPDLEGLAREMKRQYGFRI